MMYILDSHPSASIQNSLICTRKSVQSYFIERLWRADTFCVRRDVLIYGWKWERLSDSRGLFGVAERFTFLNISTMVISGTDLMYVGVQLLRILVRPILYELLVLKTCK